MTKPLISSSSPKKMTMQTTAEHPVIADVEASSSSFSSDDDDKHLALHHLPHSNQRKVDEVTALKIEQSSSQHSEPDHHYQLNTNTTVMEVSEFTHATPLNICNTDAEPSSDHDHDQHFQLKQLPDNHLHKNVVEDMLSATMKVKIDEPLLSSDCLEPQEHQNQTKHLTGHTLEFKNLHDYVSSDTPFKTEASSSASQQTFELQQPDIKARIEEMPPLSSPPPEEASERIRHSVNEFLVLEAMEADTSNQGFTEEMILAYCEENYPFTSDPESLQRTIPRLVQDGTITVSSDGSRYFPSIS